MRELLSWRWLWGWAIVLVFMATVAWASRARELDALGARITAELQPYAEHNIEKKTASGWRYNDYLYENQGSMVYLIEHHHRDPAMLRTMLLCEARRSYDHVYLYDHCFNWDLRQHLIAECSQAYPDDPLVRWASGRLLLTAGEFSWAADELLAADELGFDAAAAGTRPEYYHGRIASALLMDNRPEEAIGHLKAWRDADPADRERHFVYTEMLTLLERYAQSDAAIAQWREAIGDDFRQHTLGLRNAWWAGDTAEFETRALTAAEEVTDFVLLDWTGIRYAVLYRKFDHAREVAGERTDYYYRALAEAYALTGRVEYLERLAVERDERVAEWQRAEAEENWGRRWELRNAASAAQGNIMRAYMLRGEWDQLRELLASAEADVTDIYYAAAYQLAGLLMNMPDQPAESDNWFGYRWGSYLPWVLYSNTFADACAYRGLDAGAMRRAALDQLEFDHGTYHDGSNGELDW